MKNIPELQEEFSEESAAVLNNYRDELDIISSRRMPQDGAYLGELTAEQRQAVLRKEKVEQAKQTVEEARKDYQDVVEGYHQALDRRVSFLREQLFSVGDAGALSDAALASDTQLAVMMSVATTAGNTELGRAVFVAAEQRGLGDLMNAFYALDPEAESLYAEYSQAPPPEILDRQKYGAQVLIPDPDPDALVTPVHMATWR